MKKFILRGHAWGGVDMAFETPADWAAEQKCIADVLRSTFGMLFCPMDDPDLPKGCYAFKSGLDRNYTVFPASHLSGE